REKNAEIVIVEERLAEWFSTKTVEESVRIMSDASVSCTAVNDIAQAARSPQLRARDLLMEMPDPVAGTIHVSGNYIRLSRSQTVVGSTPAIGQHTEEVLRGLLHYPADKVQRLREGQVI
ncbi:MAG: CoA transferase, partial [Chloroflexota bacterium]|nr:CoA transferase [Chloroflexota bacterium]